MIRNLLATVFISCFTYSFASAQSNTGIIRGVVVDAISKEPLIGANVIIEGTSIGAATSEDGSYRISRVPTGEFKLIARYLGFQSQEKIVNLGRGQTIDVNFELNFQTIEGEAIQILGQAAGQAEAINRQLRSNKIVNIVSQDRINELPDQNTAEAIARLPGVSLERDGGEGQKVIIRGLSPKFTNVTINGVKLPGTDGEDRSIDLSMISTDALSGIEVFKAITPDMDADAVGGSVNLNFKRASNGLSSNLRLETGFNNLENEFGQYRTSFSTDNRYFDNKLGVILGGNFQRANRSSDRLTADFDAERARPRVVTDEVNLDDRIEIRKRFGGNVGLDYKLPNGNLFFNGFLGATNRDEERRRIRFRIDEFRTEHDMRDRESDIYLLSNSIGGEHFFDSFEVNWNSSFSRSLRKTPHENFIRFRELGAFDSDNLIEDQGPEFIPQAAKLNLEETTMLFSRFNTLRIRDRDLSSSVDIKIPYNLSSNALGYIKVGAKVLDKNRTNDQNEMQTPFGVTDSLGSANNDEFDLFRGAITINNFIDPDFSAGNFLNNIAFNLEPGLDINKMNQFVDRFRSSFETNRTVLLRNFEASERTWAGYIMTELNFGSRLMILPGVRVEQTSNDYDGFFGRLQGDLGRAGEIRDTTGGQNYHELLPMIHVKYNLTDYMDLRLAATRTLSRPDFFNLVPFENINTLESTVERGNPDLKHATIWNLDAFLTLFSGKYGLLTVGGFYKSIKDLDFIARTIDRSPGLTENFILTTPVNAQTSNVKGIEVDIQSNLGFLPNPFNGLIISFNIARMSSETFFPQLVREGRSPDPPFAPVFRDTVRSGKMPGQSDTVLNLSIGYEVGGFSVRASHIFQDAALNQVGDAEVRDIITDDIRRWDFVVSQRITPGLRVNLNLNNMTNNRDRAFFGDRAFPTTIQEFGWTGDLGIRYNF